MLKFTVYDVDRQKKHNVIGHALYPLKDHECESNERLVIWRDLEREVIEVHVYQKIVNCLALRSIKGTGDIRLHVTQTTTCTILD